MLFNSFVFPIFLLIVWGLYLTLKARPQNYLLLFASYIFYGWWDWRFLSLLFISTVVDYVCGLLMERYDSEKITERSGPNISPETQARYQMIRLRLLQLSLATNLGILGFFKYFNFFAESFSNICSPFGFVPDFVTLNILLPVGISFYTFQTMAYTIDVYRRQETACRDFLNFALYVAYFPQLVAGPIERSTRLIPQFAKPRSIAPEMIYSAVRLIFWGYFKKVFIADGVAPYVNDCFANPGEFNGMTLLLGVYLFALQIYGDFSGYTDIARGVSRLFGIELCVNFHRPYLASSVTDFWRRWHISLSTWLRDYLYIPLGGNRKGPYRTYANNMLTMLLGGLWHGAAWTFVIWGVLHGVFLAVHKFLLGERKLSTTNRLGSHSQRIWYVLCVLGTFHLICFAWVFFRADSLSSAMVYLNGIAFGDGMKMSGIKTVTVFYGLCVFFMDLSCEINDSEVPMCRIAEPRSWKDRVLNHFALRGLVYASVMFLMVFVGGDRSEPFIYFQF